jgi:aminopeptidase N
MDYEASVNEIRNRFELPMAKSRYARDLEFSINHLKLQLAVDLKEKKLEGCAEYDIEFTHDRIPEAIVLDAREMEISEVKCRGKNASFEHIGGRLHIFTAGDEGRKIEVSITYSCKPEAGFYFISPDRNNPQRPLQAWSQGEDEYSAYWFPCFDYPNMKYTTEMAITVDAGMSAISNGRLLKIVEDRKGGRRTFVWSEGVPHSTYLNSVVVGSFSVIEDRWKNIPVTYYVQPGREEEGKRSFGKTPKMIEFFSKITGVDYPYEKYAQVAVSEFIWGGMENISATTQTDETLHDARAEVDFPSHGLVAHELAHQWWGDLLTAKDWSNIWLNEGFATYFDALFREHDMGADEMHVFLDQSADLYFKEDSENYRRPIVQRSYFVPAELFDRTTYQKGALVLHMLRTELGDESFFRSLSLYCRKNMFRNVETSDLANAIEEATGRNLQWFFDQWVYRAGFPEFEIELKHERSEKKVRLFIRQVQKCDELTPLFRVDMPVSIVYKGGRREYRRLAVREREEIFEFDGKERPLFISIDPDNDILKKTKLIRPVEDALHQLKLGRTYEKILAARELSVKSEGRICEALAAELRKDNFWAVQAACARALGKINRKDSLEALLSSVNIRDSRARKEVVRAIGMFREPSSAEVLKRLFDDDSYAVASEAVTAFAKLDIAERGSVIRRAMDIPSHLDVVRQAAINSFLEFGSEEDIEFLKKFTAGSYGWRVRSSAIKTIAELGKKDRKVREFVYRQLRDGELRYRQAAIEAAEILGNREGIAELDALAERERDGRLRRRAYDAIKSIRESAGRETEGRLRGEIDSIRSDVRELRTAVDSLLKRVTEGGPGRKARGRKK